MKKRLFILGDTHFSNERDWDLESFEKFIDWFSKYDFGNKEECELLQLGDLTEKSKNAGKTYLLDTVFEAVQKAHDDNQQKLLAKGRQIG